MFPQFRNASRTLNLLEYTIENMKIKWEFYEKLGYLPKAGNVFEQILVDAQGIMDSITKSDEHIRNIFELDDFFPLINRVSDYSSDPVLGRFLDSPHLRNLTLNLFYKVEKLSDIANAINYGFLSRLVGITALEPTFGTEIGTRKFGGIQLVYNASEALMKDYAESINNITYHGLVIFGFRNRAISYPPSIVFYPIYSEHDLEYLTILSHEAYHLPNWLSPKVLFSWDKILGNDNGQLIEFLKQNFGIDWVKTAQINEIDEGKAIKVSTENNSLSLRLNDEKTKLYLEIDDGRTYEFVAKTENGKLNIYGGELQEVYEKLQKIRNDLTEILSEQDFLSNYLPEASPCPRKTLPKKDTAEIIADDLMADMYATCVAGESYTSTLQKYYLPLLIDIAQNSVSFVISSLKVRISLAMLDELGWNSAAEDRHNFVDEWENLSINAALPRFSQNLRDLNLIDIKDRIGEIINEVRRKGITRRMAQCVSKKYIPEPEEKSAFREELEELRDFLKTEPELISLINFLENHRNIRPRHLVAQIVECSDVNRNAVLMALAYDDRIMDRFS